MLDTGVSLLYDTSGMNMDGYFKQSLLYDFYGDLLTEHQKEIYEGYVLENLSLAEIAEEQNISRQGVHDIIKRCNQALEGYEAKLHLVEKFEEIKNLVAGIETCDSLEEAKHIAGTIIDKL